MSEIAQALARLVREHKEVTAAWFDDPINPTTVHIHLRRAYRIDNLRIPHVLRSLKIQNHQSAEIQILRLRADAAPPLNLNQQCQDEPIKLGTQIQPENANWLGTAGSPCRWSAQDGSPRYGILSNWHVMADGDQRRGRRIAQPTAEYPTCATLQDWSEVLPGEDNYVDCAIADALIEGKHTISHAILDVGALGPKPTAATIGLPVEKAGRTTALTQGRCIAVAAAVNVGYGTFSATFLDQDIFEANSGSFSAPGDSGSLIVHQPNNNPVALLFAGNDQMTVGNPIRHVIQTMKLNYPFL